MGTIANTPLSDAEQIFKDLVWTPVILSGEAALFAAVPALNLPVLRQLDTALINQLSSWLFNQLRLIIDIEAIRLVNQAHQSAYDEASLQLRIIAQEKGIDSEDFKQARAKAAQALAQFTQFGH